MSRTELLDIGEHCSFCGQVDFLPFKCSCKSVFCAQHKSPETHNCSQLTNIRNGFLDSREDIRTDHLPPAQSLFPIKSDRTVADSKSNPEKPDSILSSMEKKAKEGNKKNASALSKLKKFFTKSKKTSDENNDNSNNANNSNKSAKTSAPTKRIIEANKLRKIAKGHNLINFNDRLYLWVQVIDDESKFSKVERNPVYVSKQWPMGRALDNIADLLKIRNVNNKTMDQKQKLFLYQVEVTVDQYKKEQNNYIKLGLNDKCSKLKDGEIVYLVRGTEV